MMAHWRWLSGNSELRKIVEAWYTDDSPRPSVLTIRDGPQRRALRIESDPNHLFVKHFRIGSSPHPLRERLKSRLLFDAGHNEAKSIARFGNRGLPVAQSLGAAETPDGDFILILEWIEAPTLRELLREGRCTRPLLLRVAQSIGHLHAAKYSHGDLHADNILITPNGPVLIDLQRARRAILGGRQQARDLAFLDYSLCEMGVSRSDRLRVLQGATRPKTAAQKKQPRRLRRLMAEAERTRSKLTRHRVQRGQQPIEGLSWRI